MRRDCASPFSPAREVSYGIGNAKPEVQPRLLAAALPYIVFGVLAAVSWNRWIEPYVDSGRELMVPWRVAQGERLYRDVQFNHGPLAPWLGAACDRLLGRSLPARTGLAALIALAQLAALDRIARRLTSPWRAALATATAVAVAFFQRPGGWMFPFSFDCAAAVAALTWALVGAGRRPRPSDGLAAVCLLIALIARVEMGLAGVAILAFAARREPIRLPRLILFPLASGGIVYAAVSSGIPFRDLVADGWLRVIDPPDAVRNVYRVYAGLDRIGLRVTELALASVILVLIGALLCAVAAVASRLERRSAPAARAAEAAAWLPLAVLAVVSVWPPVSVVEGLFLVPPLVRVVPPVIVVAAVWRLGLRLLGREPAGAFARVPDAALWLSGVFAARLLLAAGYAGTYGAFFLPLPVLLCVVGLLAAADRAAAAIGPDLPRLTAGAVALFLLSRGASVARFYRQPGWTLVRTPVGGVRLLEPVASTTQAALADLGARVPAGGSLSGFPEAGFFTYALNLRNPSGIEQYFPGRLDEAGEDRAIALLPERPPDALLFMNVVAIGEGQRAFGTDYLRRLDSAARAAFRVEAIYGPGARPGARIGDPGFFVEIRVPEGAKR